VVGGAATWGSPAKAISATLTLWGTFFRNVRRADWAAARRDGLMSVARIEPETSMTSTTVASSEAIIVLRCGRASAMQRAASASNASAGGM
jgi:hypothetical protein